MRANKKKAARKKHPPAQKIVYRPARLGDFEQINQLLKEAQLVTDHFSRGLYARLWRRNKGNYWVASCRGKVVGNVFSSHDGGYCGYVYKLAVAPAFRSRGIGGRLLRCVVENFDRQKIGWFFAFVRFDNHASNKLFKKTGFEPIRKYVTVDYKLKG